MDLTTVLFLLSLPFVILTAYFGTKSNFYESDNYKGDGCAMTLKDDLFFSTFYASPSTIKLPDRFINIFRNFRPAFSQLSKSSIGIECREDLLCRLPQDDPLALVYMFL